MPAHRRTRRHAFWPFVALSPGTTGPPATEKTLASHALPRRFRLVRAADVTGVSGTGPVADGVLWPDGTVALRWSTATASTGVYASTADVVEIHGHGGATRIVWADR